MVSQISNSFSPFFEDLKIDDVTENIESVASSLLKKFSLNSLSLSLGGTEKVFFLSGGSVIEGEVFKRSISSSLNSEKMSLIPHFYIENQRVYSSLTRPIFFPSGKVLSVEGFINHPLFKDTKEKETVFKELAAFLNEPNFQHQYSSFLENIQKEDWHSSYQDPRALSFISLAAFLDGTLSEEELFVVHMTGSCIEESSGTTHSAISVLTKDNAESLLQSANFPPFASTFNTNKSAEELENGIQIFLSSLEEKSPILRTLISYSFSLEEESVEKTLFSYRDKYKSHKWTQVGLAQKDEVGIAILAPPSFCRELYKIASPLNTPPPVKHTFMFGFQEEPIAAFQTGRPVSIASPLFRLPFVHLHLRGKQLGTTFHDLIYHQVIDWHNPHVQLFIDLSNKIRAFFPKKKEAKELANLILDRESSYYPESWNQYSQEAAFWFTIIRMNDDNNYLKLEDDLFCIFEETLPSPFLELPLLESIIENLSFLAKREQKKEKIIAYTSRTEFLKRFYQYLSEKPDPSLIDYYQTD